MSTYPYDRIPVPTPARLKEELLLRKPPFWMIAILIIGLTASWLPIALLLRARVSTSEQPRVHWMQDMANQPRYSTQQPSPIFEDGRAMRLPVEGTVARGFLAADDHLDRGFHLVQGADNGATKLVYFNGLPPQIDMDARLLQRGQKLFNIYCAACHGADGYGNGAINQRAERNKEPKWVSPSNIHALDKSGKLQYGSELYPDGKLYNTIRNGIRNMPAYGSQIETRDRWAVVAYVRALQRSQHASINDVPAEERDRLR